MSSWLWLGGYGWGLRVRGLVLVVRGWSRGLRGWGYGLGVRVWVGGLGLGITGWAPATAAKRNAYVFLRDQKKRNRRQTGVLCVLRTRNKEIRRRAGIGRFTHSKKESGPKRDA